MGAPSHVTRNLVKNIAISHFSSKNCWVCSYTACIFFLFKNLWKIHKWVKFFPIIYHEISQAMAENKTIPKSRAKSYIFSTNAPPNIIKNIGPTGNTQICHKNGITSRKKYICVSKNVNKLFMSIFC